MSVISLNQQETGSYAKEIQQKITYGLKKSAAHYIAANLGALTDGTYSRFLLWHPKIKSASSVKIHLYTPVQSFLFDKPEQHISVTCHTFPLSTIDEYACGVFEGLRTGNREQFGAFYEFTLHFPDGTETVVRDPMAWSMPYGIYAPSELYDVEKVRREREDKEYFKRLQNTFNTSDTNRIGPSVNLLEVHTGTATKYGTLQSLSDRYAQIARKLNNKGELSPDEQNLLGFDAIQLMPVDPLIEHPENHKFWVPVQKATGDGDEITVYLTKPSIINWGYDIVIFGSAAINPSILSTGRPHELLNLIETLHNFPGQPIKVILDVVYGHADNQGLKVMPEEFFAGSNMYGQNIQFSHPLVRAMILEMQRRKIDWGFDGIRVDGAQDFKYYDKKNDQLIHDDDFLNEMSEVDQNVAGVRYKPWMIFEDGRPWPRDDWELASTYREITEQQGHPFQWASMIFAYNTPYNYTYWVSKWWRLKEILKFGDKWISGYANHDTMRRGTQTNPSAINVNFQLGNSFKMVMDNAYNNTATTLVMNGFLPGVPMDFVQALGNTPWSFIRNTDKTYAIKVAAEEAFFTEWQITEVEFRNSRFFRKLKDLGFSSLAGLRRFSICLLHLVDATDYNPENIAVLLNNFTTPFQVKDWDVNKLNRYAEAWAEDLHFYCNADMHTDTIEPRKASFNLSVRQFRLKNSWLRSSFKDDDCFLYREPVDGTVIFYGYRKDAISGKELILAANMEGQTRQIHIPKLGLPVRSFENWKVALSTPSLKVKNIDQPIKLSITQGILYQRTL